MDNNLSKYLKEKLGYWLGIGVLDLFIDKLV